MHRRTVGAAGLFALLFACALSATDARAYLDAGTGSYIIQILIAGLVGASFVVRMFWKNIRAYIGSRFGKKTER